MTKVMIVDDDFDHVRQALKNGAVDYILKHKLDAHTLADTLRMTQNQLGKPVELNLPGNIFAMKRDFVMKLISGCYISMEETANRATAMDLKLGSKNAVVILMRVQNQNTTAVDAYLREYSVEKLCKNLYQKTARPRRNGVDILAIYDAVQEKSLLQGIREQDEKRVSAVIDDIFT